MSAVNFSCALLLQLMAAAEILPQLISDKDVAAGLVYPSLEVRQQQQPYQAKWLFSARLISKRKQVAVTDMPAWSYFMLTSHTTCTC